jgi:Family of unknown function (DUF6318)
VITQRPIRRPIILRARVLVAAAAVAATTGCSGGGSGPESTSATSGTTTTPPTTSVAAPVLPEAAKHPTVAGAEAFYRYFWDVYSYAFRNGKSSAIMGVAAIPECTYCSSAIKNIDGVTVEGYHFEGGEVSPRLLVAAPGKPEVGILINSTLDQKAGTTRTSTGEIVKSEPAAVGIRIDAVVRWVNQRWLMAEAKVIK